MLQTDGGVSLLGLPVTPVVSAGIQPDQIHFTVGSDPQATEGNVSSRFASDTLSVTVDPRMLPKSGGRGRRKGRGRGQGDKGQDGRGRGDSQEEVLPRMRDARLRKCPKPRQFYDA